VAIQSDPNLSATDRTALSKIPAQGANAQQLHSWTNQMSAPGSKEKVIANPDGATAALIKGGATKAQAQQIVNGIVGKRGQPAPATNTPQPSNTPAPQAQPTAQPSAQPTDEFAGMSAIQQHYQGGAGHGTHGIGSMAPIQQGLDALGSMFNQGARNTTQAPAGANVAQNEKSIVSDTASIVGRGAQNIGKGLGAGAQGVQSAQAQKALSDEAWPTVLADLKRGVPAPYIAAALQAHGLSKSNASALVIRAHTQNSQAGEASSTNPFGSSR
jgi:hypothetical protein